MQILCSSNYERSILTETSNKEIHEKRTVLDKLSLLFRSQEWRTRGCCYIPAASACFDAKEKDRPEYWGFDTIEDVADLKREMIGLSMTSCVGSTWPSLPGLNPNHGATWIKWIVSTSFCSKILGSRY